MGTLMQDVRYALRMLRKNPGFTLIAVLTLALGIGANTAIFSVIDAELLKPLPFRDPGQLVQIGTADSMQHVDMMSSSYPDFADWRAQNHVCASMAAYQAGSVSLTGVETPAHLEQLEASADLFELLGAKPELGRTFLPEEDQQHHVVILSDRLWRQTFGADRRIIGKTIVLDGIGYTVVGVMPASFQFPLRRKPIEVWHTFLHEQEPQDDQRGAHFLSVIARLKPGVSIAQAQAAMNVITAALARQYPDTNKHFGAHVVSEQQDLTGAIRPALLVMIVAVGFVLLIACANVANLLLARATTRIREIAIRAALGAGRARVVRQLLTESLLLGLLAGALGLLIASWGNGILVRLSTQDLPRAGTIHVDGWVLAFTAGISILTGILFGLAPALQVSRSNLVDSLKEGSLSTTAGTSRHRLRSALVIVEVALAVVLLVGAGLLIRSLSRLQDVNPGFNPSNVMAADLDLPAQKYTNEKQGEFSRDLMSRLSALPGVSSAAGITPLPMSGSEVRTSFEIEGRPVAKSDEPVTSFRVATPGYFGTMQIPLLRGRDFTVRDDLKTTQVVIINDTFAREFFHGENPIGKRITPGVSIDANPAPAREIVGVVGSVKFQNLATSLQPETYAPFAQVPWGQLTIVARSAKDPYVLAKPIAETIRSIDTDLPAYNEKTVEDYLDGTIAVPRFNAVLLAVFAGLALVLTAVGLYGVISYSVAQRTHEIGIRMALGAQPGDMLRLIIGEGTRLTLIGIGIGIVGALALTRFLAGLLFGVSTMDPVSFAVVVVVLLAIVTLASYLPARRAMRVDPMVALRYE